MAITIDQFLRELTERRLLSGEEASAFRQEFTPAAKNPLSTSRNEASKNGSSSDTATQTVSVSDTSPLVLCNCLLKERIQERENHLIFQAHNLQNNTPVWLHIFTRRQSAGEPHALNANGKVQEADPNPSPAVGILDVGWHGDMVCVCCQTIEAESLREIVQQYENLPLELATESLLETVKTLERLQSQGLRLDAVSPEQLLLDEDGHIHLTGQNPAAILASSLSPTEESLLPTQELLESLGALYIFLQTGAERAPSGQPDSPSAGLIYRRLNGANGMPRYQSWTDLSRDLQAVLDGRELALPSVPRESKPAASTPPAKAPTVSTSTSSTRGLLIGLALFVMIVVVVIAIIMR